MTPLRLALLALIVGGCAMPFGIKPNRAVDPPPAGWEKLGLHPAWTVRNFDSLRELQQFCRDNGVPYDVARKAGDDYAMACAIRDLKTVALPTSKAWPSRKEIEAAKPHEYAHSWSLGHDPNARDKGRGTWVMPDGSPAFPLSDTQVKMMRGMAERAAAKAGGVQPLAVTPLPAAPANPYPTPLPPGVR